MNLRATLAILVCKAVRGVARVLRKGGTAKPGELALKICPDLLHIVSRGVDTVVVTGTNGKTTSCRMLEEAFAEMGEKCIANRSGANLMSGITTEFVMCCDLRGRCSRRFAVMECDEGWTKHVLPALHRAEDALTLSGTCVLMKSGSRMPEVRDALRRSGRKVCAAENCTMENERLYRDLEEIPDDAGYFSLLIAKEP